MSQWLSVDEDRELTEQEILDLYSDRWQTITFNARQCVPAVLESLFPLFLRLFLCSFLQGLVYRIKVNNLSHLIVVSLAFYLLTFQLEEKWTAFVAIGYYCASILVDTMFLGRKERGPASILVAIIYIGVWQTQLSSIHFMQIRGSLMIMAMKSISFSFDGISASIHERNAYIFNPSTVLFGPFISYRSFKINLLTPNNFWKTSALSLVYLIFSSFCVLYSSCFVEFIPDHVEILKDYGAAQSYRFSHYFICYLSLATVLMAGMSTSYQTTKLSAIELPRSMSEVVVHWNHSMHEFLHKYIYTSLLSYGYFVAMIGSFVMSSLLHGFNFQLTAVLMSLAYYAYSESVFRSRLAHRLSACVRSRSCSSNCLHKRNNLSIITFTINMLFFALNVYHLIYLGMPFDGTAEEVGYSWHHTLDHWKRWNFSSHLLNTGLLVLSFII
ncbi:MBOAT family protein [Aphelenchoides besseyi]|nr:MBOAT family protein [Aphelenchoides besseyi]